MGESPEDDVAILGGVRHGVLMVLAAVLLAGCGAAEPQMVPATQAGSAASVPTDGEAVDLEFAPEGFSMPSGAVLVEQIDQVNNVTLMFTEPDGAAVLDYYRRALPAMGFTITADANGALTFENAEWQGAATTADDVAAITMRTDWESR